MVQSRFDHHHNQMATYHGNPLAIGSCWGLEVEMLDRHDEQWKRMSDFPNPGKANALSLRDPKLECSPGGRLKKTINP